MGFLEKLKLVETVQPEEVMAYSMEDYADPEVDLENVNTDTLIDDIYVQNNLHDKSKSIFKVEELINSLPKEMVTETKKMSVLSALGVFGLTATEMVEDGKKREDVLGGVISKVVQEGIEEMTSKESEIEEHKKEIARLEKEILNRQNELKISEETINEEKVRIEELIKFIGGAE